MAVNPETLIEFSPRPAGRGASTPPLLTTRSLVRAGFGVAAVACALAGLALRLGAGGGDDTAAVSLLFWLLSVLALAGLWLPERWATAAMTALLAALTLAIGGSAAALGWGLAAPGLLLPGLLVFALGAASGWRAAAVLAAVATGSLLALHGGLMPGPAVPTAAGAGAPSAAHLLATHLGAIAIGLLGGAMVSLGLARRLDSAVEREQRYRGLLALAADAYWEMDHQYRLTAAVSHDDESRRLTANGGLGQAPWELPRFICDADTLDLLQADLDTRAPFRDLPIGWLGSDGRALRFLVSGEPRFGERGEFIGYWGLARDITADTAAREALVATETRYQELFTRIPTPLVLHRAGRVFDANPAALRLYGQPDLASMIGSNLLTAFESGDSRERARRRLEELEELPAGTALPVTDFRLLVNGRPLWVRATGVRVTAGVGGAAEGGLATLSIFVDDTERRSAEEAVRRSEAMLSHLVATSPDLITLTDLATGRYVMTNHAFERVLGHRTAEAVGRTALELGVWQRSADRDRFVALMKMQGTAVDVPVNFVHKNGNPVKLLVSAARFAMDRREYMVINARDVTESERAQLEREAILANASVGIAVTRAQRFVLANRHFEQLYGWPAGEVVGQSSRAMWPSDADYTEVGALVVPPLTRGESVQFERPAQRRDGSTFLAHVHGSPIDPQRPAESGTVWIVEDVTERRQFEQALARARDDAEAANRAKSAFLANTSHELRTPLNAMIHLARLSAAADVDPAKRGLYLAQIVDSTQSLAGIIDAILDLSKIEAGKLQIAATDFDLAEMLRSLQGTYAILAAERGLTLEFELADSVQGRVDGDPLRLRQIVTNFITNALKFTERGRIVVAAWRLAGPGEAGHDQVHIEVRDTGTGIAPEVLARLFKPFTQADESTTRRFGGTGLGLSICRELATLMGGRVGVDSQPGQGSRFWAELPLPPALHDALPPEARPNAHSLQGARVLMVEDNPVNMMIAVAMLERWGVQVEQAGDGGQAVQAALAAAAAGQPFDAVLMDVQMPVMSGHEATRALRAHAHTADLPVIALTAAALVSEREEAMQAGMNEFLTKPIDADRLLASLARWVKRRD